MKADKTERKTKKECVNVVDEAAMYFEKGLAFEKNQNYRQAVIYYSAAAELGHLEAAYQTGLCYQEGLGVRCNSETAFSYFMQAARQGHAAAQNQVGICFEQGKGVKKDRSESVVWYRKAALQRNGAGVYNLGRCFEWGSFDQQNLSMALRLYERAVELGCEDARKAAERLSWVSGKK